MKDGKKEIIVEKIDLEKRSKEKPHISREDICKGLIELGLKRGSVVLVHSSLSRFGYVEGSADSVINALIKIVGEKGTVVVPGFSFSLGKDVAVFDVKNTPSEMGKISETIHQPFSYDFNRMDKSLVNTQ